MIKIATKQDIPQIFNLMLTIWQDMNYPLLHLLDFDVFQSLMYQLMTNPLFKFHFGNCLTFKEDGTIKGILYYYDGSKEELYNQFLLNYIKINQPHINTTQLQYGLESFNDELYIDALIVHEHYRHQKIGTQLLNHIITHTAKKIGLNCEVANTKALKLYEHLGFYYQEPVTFLGHTYLHLVKENKNNV